MWQVKKNKITDIWIDKFDVFRVERQNTEENECLYVIGKT